MAHRKISRDTLFVEDTRLSGKIPTMNDEQKQKEIGHLDDLIDLLEHRRQIIEKIIARTGMTNTSALVELEDVKREIEECQRRKSQLAAQLTPFLPLGWCEINEKYLAIYRSRLLEDGSLQESNILTFFDGSFPDWCEALCTNIPRRAIVQTIVDKIHAVQQEHRLSVTLLSGAVGEGKTTVLMQAICDIVDENQNVRIIWHEDVTNIENIEHLYRLTEHEGNWLIVSDEAGFIAKDVFKLVARLNKNPKFHFLLCTRDTDWLGAKANEYEWDRHTSFDSTTLTMPKLNQEDAEKIVAAWNVYGAAGLQDLYQQPAQQTIKEMAQRMITVAGDIYKKDRSFLGCMLTLRYQKKGSFPRYVRSLLQRLKERDVLYNHNLLEVFICIAAMHAINQPILTEKVLARALDYPESLIQFVIRLLASEAATEKAVGRKLFTRHKRIAETAIDIVRNSLDNPFDIDLDGEDGCYVRLVKAARSIYIESQDSSSDDFKKDIERWNRLPHELFNQGQRELAFHLGRALVDIEPHDPFPVTNLAKLYREAKNPKRACRLFRQQLAYVHPDRAYFYEWSTAEGKNDNHYLSTWLGGVSLADTTREQRRDENRTMTSLSGLATSLGILYTKTNDLRFLSASVAAAQLGLAANPDEQARKNLLDRQSAGHQRGMRVIDPTNILPILTAGMMLAAAQAPNELSTGGSEFIDRIPTMNHLTFTLLEQFIN